MRSNCSDLLELNIQIENVTRLTKNKNYQTKQSEKSQIEYDGMLMTHR